MSLKNRVKNVKEDIIKYLTLKHFSIKEMGYSFGDEDFGFIHLHSKFFNKHIRPCFDDKLRVDEYIGKWDTTTIETNVACPFCDKGILVLTKKKKDIDKIAVVHLGNNYTLKCFNCKSTFIYNNQWTYIN